MPRPDEMITWEEFNSWKQQSITRLVAAAREREIIGLEKDMGDGGTLDAENPYSTAYNTSFRVGYIKGLKEALDPPLDYIIESLKEERSEEEEEL